MPLPRTRLIALLSAALVAGGVVAAAAPASAMTFDNHPIRDTVHFTVVGKHYTLYEASYGPATQTVHVGQASGKVWSHYRLTFRTNTGRALKKVERALYEDVYIVRSFEGRSFPTDRAFRAAERRALTVSAATAKAQYLKDLRIASVDADVETNTGRTLDYLKTLPAGTAPDFNAVRTVVSDEYPGSVTVSGADRTHWSVIVRDTRDGYGEFSDNLTGSGGSFRF